MPLKVRSTQIVMQTAKKIGDDIAPVSLLKVKDLAQRLLPINSSARSLILAEKDVLPVAEAVAKFEVFDMLLTSELVP
jgi:hypothetical protein